MPKTDDPLEIRLILHAINRRYGYDFRRYTREHIVRQLDRRLSIEGLDNYIQLLEKILHEPSFFDRMLHDFSITVTEMFRDPQVYKGISEHIAPYLHTFPSLKVWDVGCATGEETYSLAILLEEAGLLERTWIYATDFNEEALRIAEEGIYAIDTMREHSTNYVRAGGRRSLSDYFTARYDAVVFSKRLKERIVFSVHNLATDASSGVMHLIVCRNVLIYFTRELQRRVIGLFVDSLTNGGFLCLGTKETVEFTGFEGAFQVIDGDLKLYKKRLV